MRTMKMKNLNTGIEKRKEYRRNIFRWIALCLVVMIAVQVLLQWNQHKIFWIDGNYTDVSLSRSGELIVAVDSESGRAGAINLKGEVIIPFESKVFDPWDGSLIQEGIRQDGNLFWVIKDKKVGIVDQENQAVIPQEYGYLKKTQEDQFIAGKGEISNALTGGGSYIHKKFGVITGEGKELIPFEYDSLRMLDDGRYEGVIEEEKRTITRIFYNSGNLEKEETIEKEVESTEEPTGEDQDTGQESGASEEDPEEAPSEDETEQHPEQPPASPEGNQDTTGAAGNEEGTAGEGQDRENGEIQDYDGVASDFDAVNYYTAGGSMKIHLNGTKCTLEDEYGNVLVTFEGDRVQETIPVFDRGNKVVVDEGEGFYRVYNANTGVLLCDVKRAAECILTDNLVAYEQAAEYIVKNLKNTEVFRIEKGSDDQFMNSPNEKARFVFQPSYFVFQADTGRTLITNSGIVIAKNLDSISYNDENNNKTNPEEKVFICERDGEYGAFNGNGDKILDFVYDNIEFFNGHKAGLRVTQEKGHVGIVDYKGQVIIPLEYDSVGYGSHIEEANSSSIVEYELLNSALDRYYGKSGNNIYYLDEEGNEVEEVRYVRKEESDRDLNDVLTGKKDVETPKEFRTTGNLLIMDNTYSSRMFFGRCEIHTKVEKERIRFILVDSNAGKIGTYEYRFGDFTLMGYQHFFWYIWLISSRIFFILFLAIAFLSVPYEDISDRFYFWRKKMKKRKRGKVNEK